MKISMNVDLQILYNGVPLNKRTANSVSIGGYYFIINGNEIPFDWDAFAGDEENNIFSFQTGYGFLFDDFELSDCYDEDYEALNLTRESITAEFLASVEKINEFHINFINENDKEIDLGYNDDEQYKIKIMLIEFVDVNTGNVYKVNQNVIDKYNMNN